MQTFVTLGFRSLKNQTSNIKRYQDFVLAHQILKYYFFRKKKYFVFPSALIFNYEG